MKLSLSGLSWRSSQLTTTHYFSYLSTFSCNTDQGLLSCVLALAMALNEDIFIR